MKKVLARYDFSKPFLFFFAFNKNPFDLNVVDILSIFYSFHDKYHPPEKQKKIWNVD